MRILAQSYDWLLFLTDDGLSEFIECVLNGHQANLSATRAAFKASFGRAAGSSSPFTKVTIDAKADHELTDYFKHEQPWERWFNIIAPTRKEKPHTSRDNFTLDRDEQEVKISELRDDLHTFAKIFESRIK